MLRVEKRAADACIGGREGERERESIRQHTSAYVRICFEERAADARSTASVSVPTFKATSSIRQHSSAYVSIRQRTSAYVSILPRGTWVQLALHVISTRILRDGAAPVCLLGERGAFRQVDLVIQTVGEILVGVDAVAYPATPPSVSVAIQGPLRHMLLQRLDKKVHEVEVLARRIYARRHEKCGLCLQLL